MLSNLSVKYKRALVTGGAGFIGSHLCQSLLGDGLEVISVDDYCAGKVENHSEYINHPSFTAVKCDITDKDQLRKYFDGVDIVFNQAASKNTVCMQDPSRDLQVNANGTLNVLQLSRDFGIKKVVHASTGSVYGDAKYYPTDEKHAVNPNSFYGVSKLAGEKYARLFHHLYNMDITILRYFHVFGPRQDYSDVGGVVSIFGRNAVNNETLTIYGDGTQLRSFTYVDDVVSINKLVALSENTAGEAYNCASGAKVTISQLASAVLKHFEKSHIKINYENWRMGDVKVFDVSNEKIRSLGHEFKYDFATGLGLTLNWIESYIDSQQKVQLADV